MITERTLSMIKPDAIRKNIIGEIYSRFERAGLKIIAAKMLCLSHQQAEVFYEAHREKPFFDQLTHFISSGPIMVQLLEGLNAIQLNRTLMGATDPKHAALGTIRADFGTSIDENSIHGSDSLETAQREIQFFFKPNEIFS